MAPADDVAAAQAEAWNHGFGFIKTSVVRTAIELEIPDIIQSHGAPLSLSALSSAVGCSVERLHRIMRFLAHHGIFKKTDPPPGEPDTSSLYYAQTPVSRNLTKDGLGPYALLQSAAFEPSACITAEGLKSQKRAGFKDSGSDSLYDDPLFATKVFRDAMACHAKSTTSAMIKNYGEGFEGVRSVVDVGGSYGKAIGMLTEAFPWIHGICYDLPQVVAKASPLPGVEFVAGSMFDSVPKADIAMLMFVLHNWSDKECIEILKKCKEAAGKVIIIDTIIDEEGDGDEFAGARLALDMTMLAVTFEGKERTYKEWVYLLQQAGFQRHVVKNIKALESVIEAYP